MKQTEQAKIIKKENLKAKRASQTASLKTAFSATRHRLQADAGDKSPTVKKVSSRSKPVADKTVLVSDLSREAPKDRALNIRASQDWFYKIDKALEISGEKSRSEFVLMAALAKAESVLLEQKVIFVDEEKYNLFIDRLDAEPQPNERLLKTLRKNAPWES